MQCPVAHPRTSQKFSGRSGGKCPFNQARPTPVGNVGAGRTGDNATSTALRAVSSDSPEAVAALNGCPFGYAASEPVREPSGADTSCPMAHGQQQSHVEISAEQESAPAQCPMGFTAADGPRMTEFHCVICKSLLYDCVQLSCTCKYCRYCVAAYHDCPLCGADITSRTPEPKLQGMVDQYIAAHAGTQNLFDIGKSDSTVQVGEATSDSRSAFLLQLAVRSAAGGNHPAAIDRLQKCKAELQRQVEQQGHTAALCSKLGAVCGSQGVCHRQLQQPQQAKACYEESMQHLRSCNSQHPEVVHPLAVSHNKLGDLAYGQGDLQTALAQYQQGLAVREQALHHPTHPPGPGQYLDVAVSNIKVADACQALGQQEEASRMFSKALQLVQEVHGNNKDSPDIVARCKSLLAFLESRRSQQ
ncbi:hypothetical protein ABBQ38_014440 [Trebouxia sp. C0009 RCD-2024]